MSTLQASSSKSSDAGAALRRAAEEAIAAGSAKWAKKAREEAERRAAVMEGGPPRMSKALIITDKFGNPIDFTKIKSKSASSSTASSKTIVAAAAVGDVAGDVKKSLCQLAPPSSKSNAKEAITTGMANKTSDKTERTEYNSTALSTQNGTMIKEEEERADAVLDGELTALLRMWDLEDAAEALAEHGWKSVSRLKHFQRNKHMEGLDLPSGTVCALEAMLQSIPFGIFATNSSGETIHVEVMPSDTIDDELTALLRMWDLEDAAEALAEHGWKSVSRLQHFKHDKHMEGLDLPSGTVCVLQAMLQSIPCDIFATNSSGETTDIDVKLPDNIDDELTALLRMWDLEDAAEALAEHGWKSVSRLKHFKRNKHMEGLDLPSGTVCALEAMLQSIPSDVFVNNLSGETLNVDVMPPDTHDALISAIPSRLNDLDKAFVSIKTYRDTLQCKQDLVLEMNEARSEEVKLVEEKIKSKIMLGNQKVALTVQQTDIERNISTELLEKKRNLKKKIIDLNNENNIDNNHDYDAYAFKPLSRDDAETRKR